jgi:hypothetical protein
MDVSLTCWRAGETAFDRSGRARREMAAKLRRDVTANVENIDSINFDRPLGELLDRIDFEAAEHWLARFSRYRRRERTRRINYCEHGHRTILYRASPSPC